MYEEITLSGEYWIQDENVDFADGDIGDQNHESIAIQSVIHQYADDIVSYAEDLDIEAPRRNIGWDDIDGDALASLLQQIAEKFEDQGMSEKQANTEIMKHLGCNVEAYQILHGGGDARLYAMKYENWIAVRGNNIELYGYDERKRQYLYNGLGEILDSEGIDHDTPPEEIDFTLYDHKTGRSIYITYQDIENPAPVARPKQDFMSVKRVSGSNKDSEENKGQNPSPSVKNKWTQAAQTAKIIPPGHDLWRRTSEGWMPFSKWLILREANARQNRDR